MEINKNLNKIDISNLTLICSNPPLPIVQYLVEKPEGAEINKTNIFLANDEFQDIDSQCESLAKLQELGLIKISYNDWYVDMNIYSAFIDYENEHPEFKELFRKRGLIFSTDTAKNLINNI